MSALGIDFQDGFASDQVLVRVGDRDVYRKDGVTTNLAISRADAAQVEVGDGPVDVHIAVPSRGLTRTFRVDPSASPFLGVSIEQDGLNVRTSSEPFYYL